MNYQDRIVRDPQIVGGEPVLTGTRVTVKTVLASLAEGATRVEILADFPTPLRGRASGHRLCCCVRPGGSAVGRNAGQTVRIKLDEDLPGRLVAVLTTLGHDVDTVYGEQLTGRVNPDVWSALFLPFPHRSALNLQHPDDWLPSRRFVATRLSPPINVRASPSGTPCHGKGKQSAIWRRTRCLSPFIMAATERAENRKSSLTVTCSASFCERLLRPIVSHDTSLGKE